MLDIMKAVDMSENEINSRIASLLAGCFAGEVCAKIIFGYSSIAGRFRVLGARVSVTLTGPEDVARFEVVYYTARTVDIFGPLNVNYTPYVTMPLISWASRQTDIKAIFAGVLGLLDEDFRLFSKEVAAHVADKDSFYFE